MAEEGNKKKRVDFLAGFFLIGTALLFDVLSLVPFVNIVVSPIAWLVFSLWFYLLGAGLVNAKRLATATVSLVAEFIPLVSMLPTITLGVIIIIVMIKLEDRIPLLKKAHETASAHH